MQALKRTQIYFPEDVLRKLKRKASEKKTTMAGVIREAVAESFSKEGPKDWERDTLWDMVGAGRSKEGDISISHDVYLYGKRK